MNCGGPGDNGSAALTLFPLWSEWSEWTQCNAKDCETYGTEYSRRICVGLKVNASCDAGDGVMKSSLLRKRPCLKAGCLDLKQMALEQLTMKATVVSHKVPAKTQAPKIPSSKPVLHSSANTALSRPGILPKQLSKSGMIPTPIATNKPEMKPVGPPVGPVRGKIPAPILHPSKATMKKLRREYFDESYNGMQSYPMDMEYYPYKYK